jgi:ComF family protein
MPSLTRPWSMLSGLSLSKALPALRCHCLMCGSWQQRSLCDACLGSTQRRVARCLRCAIELGANPSASTCQLCNDQSPEFDRAITALDYAQPWSSVLARLKFHEGTALAAPLGELLAQAVKARGARADWVLPVPLSRQRMAERGYNQSWLLAKAVAQSLGLRARHDLVGRHWHTPRLMQLDAEQRRAQIHGAFEVSEVSAQQMVGRDLAVVDDVMTTGATLNELSATLLAAGARSVSVWVVARTPTPEPTSRR